MLGVEAGTLPLGRAFRYNLSSKLGVFFTSCKFSNFLASVEEEKEAKSNTNINKMDEEILILIVCIAKRVVKKGVFFTESLFCRYIRGCFFLSCSFGF